MAANTQTQPASKPALKMAPTKPEPKDPFEEAADKKAKKDARRNEALKKVVFDAKGHPVLTDKGGKPVMGIPNKAFYLNQPAKPGKVKEGDEAGQKEANKQWAAREAWRNAARGQVLQYAVYKAQDRLDTFLASNDPKAKAKARKAKLEAELARLQEEIDAE